MNVFLKLGSLRMSRNTGYQGYINISRYAPQLLIKQTKTKGATLKVGDDVSKSILSEIQTFCPLAKIQGNNTKHINYFHNSPQY